MIDFYLLFVSICLQMENSRPKHGINFCWSLDFATDIHFEYTQHWLECVMAEQSYSASWWTAKVLTHEDSWAVTAGRGTKTNAGEILF